VVRYALIFTRYRASRRVTAPRGLFASRRIFGGYVKRTVARPAKMAEHAKSRASQIIVGGTDPMPLKSQPPCGGFAA
jgi:hypothetical protein